MVVAFPIRSLGWLLGEFPRSVVGFRRVRSVLAETGEMQYGGDAVATSAGGARLEVSHVGFRYPDAVDEHGEPGAAVLDDITFTVEPGRTVAIVGATASGKSTLA